MSLIRVMNFILLRGYVGWCFKYYIKCYPSTDIPIYFCNCLPSFCKYVCNFFPTGPTTHCGFVFCSPLAGLEPPRVRGFLITQRLATVSRTTLDEWSVRRRDLYLTTQYLQQTNIHALGGIRTHGRRRRTAVDLSLRPSDHWDRQNMFVIEY